MMHGTMSLKKSDKFGLSLLNYQDDARSNKHKNNNLFNLLVMELFFF